MIYEIAIDRIRQVVERRQSDNFFLRAQPCYQNDGFARFDQGLAMAREELSRGSGISPSTKDQIAQSISDIARNDVFAAYERADHVRKLELEYQT